MPTSAELARMGVKTVGKGKSGLYARSLLEHALQVLEKAGEDHNDTSSMEWPSPRRPYKRLRPMNTWTLMNYPQQKERGGPSARL